MFAWISWPIKTPPLCTLFRDTGRSRLKRRREGGRHALRCLREVDTHGLYPAADVSGLLEYKIFNIGKKAICFFICRAIFLVPSMPKRAIFWIKVKKKATSAFCHGGCFDRRQKAFLAAACIYQGKTGGASRWPVPARLSSSSARSREEKCRNTSWLGTVLNMATLCSSSM